MAILQPGRLAPVTCLAVMLCGCTVATDNRSGRQCPPGHGVPMTAYELFFGRSIAGHGEVTDSVWTDFLEHVVTPNLPNGYTVFDAAGHWRDPGTGHGVQERTKVLLAALPDTPDSAATIARIRQAYGTRFHQSLVGQTTTTVCAAF
jgi:hypothetical protein